MPVSDYSIHDLARAGLLARGRSEIAAPHGADGELEFSDQASGSASAAQAGRLGKGAEPSWRRA